MESLALSDAESEDQVRGGGSSSSLTGGSTEAEETITLDTGMGRCSGGGAEVSGSESEDRSSQNVPGRDSVSAVVCRGSDMGVLEVIRGGAGCQAVSLSVHPSEASPQSNA